MLLFGMLSFKFFNFLRQFAIIRLLSPSDYGLFALGMTIVTSCMVFGGLGLYSGAQRFIAYHQARGDEPRTRGTVASSLRIVAASAAVFTLLSLLLAAPLASLFDKPGLEEVMLWFTPLVPLSIGILIMSSFFMGFKKPGFSVFVDNLGISLVSLIVVLVFLSFRRDLSSLLAGQVLAHSLVFLAALLYAATHFPIRLSGEERTPVWKELLLFSLPLLTANALGYLMEQTDTLVLGYYMTSEKIGFYNAAYLLATVIPVFLAAAGTMLLPVASGLVAGEHRAELRELYRSVTKWLFILTLPLFLIFSLFPSQTMQLVFGGEYLTATRALQLLCLGGFVNTFLGPNSTMLIAFGRSRFLMSSSLAATAVNIALNLLLVPRWGINGAATASLTALILLNTTNSAYLHYRYRIHPFGASYLKPVLLLVAASASLYLPLRELLTVSRWILVAYYPLLLAAGLIITWLSRSLEPVDLALAAAIRQRMKRARPSA